MLTIVQPTSLGKEDELPFIHAVALARRTGAHLVSVHANDEEEAVDRLPPAEALVERWRLEGRPMVHERLVHRCCEDPVETVLDALDHTHPDLVITGTGQRTGWRRFVDESAAEAIARNISIPTLVIPASAAGFVDEGGQVRLDRLIVPIGDAQVGAEAVARAEWLAETLNLDHVELVLLTVGSPGAEVTIRGRWRARRHAVRGDVVEEIVAQGSEGCVIVMATRGHDSLRDAVLGSHTDAVIRRATCPVLVCPV